MKKWLKLIMLFAVLTITMWMVGCYTVLRYFPLRDYREDLVIELQDPSEKIIVKEWSFLLGGGAEIYYQKGIGFPVLLGNTSTDDGFCPFQEGLYEIQQDDRQITVKWCFDYVYTHKANWESETFELPER